VPSVTDFLDIILRESILYEFADKRWDISKVNKVKQWFSGVDEKDLKPASLLVGMDADVCDETGLAELRFTLEELSILQDKEEKGEFWDDSDGSDVELIPSEIAPNISPCNGMESNFVILCLTLKHDRQMPSAPTSKGNKNEIALLPNQNDSRRMIDFSMP